MDQVKISPKFQIVIPKAVRESLGLVAGQRLQVVPYGNCIELVPVADIGDMRGCIAGIDTHVEREPDRPL
ncbi:MAG: AbrB/MazE/SpoVT family DNA-binding domain-containing protein [Acidobacteria bacterium]|nr:AbrB/MazE/SpoVT family DNA-binding domain-containing protein [Acidobacteriota bacterium]